MLRKYLLQITPLLLALLAAACTNPVEQVPTAVPQAPTLPPAPETQAPTPTNQPGCSVVSSSFAPNPLENSPIPAIDAQDWTRGPETAPLTIIEYGDFQ